MTHSDAESAVRDGSYKAASDEVLREMHVECLNVGGPNVAAVQRIRKVGDIIWEELSLRQKRRMEQQNSSGLLIGASALPATRLQNVEKPHQPWDEAKLKNLITDGIEESLTLEYKAAAALSREPKKVTEITKDVSAMANSAGGILIYGIGQFQQKDQNHLPERIDPIKRVDFSKEWLEHVIGQIRPRISDISIQPISLSSGPDLVLYVVQIPQSTTAHQANDFRYYRRYNFEAVPMLDHEVRDVMNRGSHPRVEVSARFVVYTRLNSEGDAGALAVSILNQSDILARYVGLIVNAPLRIRDRLISYNDAILDETGEGASYRLTFSNRGGVPLFPRGTLRPLFPFKFINRMVPEPTKQISDFRFVVFADSMPKLAGTFSLEQIYSPPA